MLRRFVGVATHIRRSLPPSSVTPWFQPLPEAMSDPHAPTGSDPDDDATLPRRVLLLGADALADDPGAHWIAAAMHHPERDSLVHTAQERDAEAFVLDLSDAFRSNTSDWLDALEAAPLNLPGVCVAPHADRLPVDFQQRAMALGVQVLLESMPEPAALRRQLRWAIGSFNRFSALRAQLDDRKWTDRAKGLLMSARELDEESAFRLLRDAAMHAHLRLGEVARSVVQSAQLAEAVNLAGQQRMLSQRLLKLMAQRAAGIEVKRAKALQDESCVRVNANLARLPALVTGLPPSTGAPIQLVDPVIDAWHRLEPLLIGKPATEALAAADAAAQDLLTHSDALATALAASGGGKPLHVVNVCGRQRMLSQQLAKEALLADLLPGRDPVVLLDSLDRFAAGLAELESSPLSSDAIRALLAEVGAEWLRLMRSVRVTHGREAAEGLARSSEVMLDRLELLTVHYQQSLQIILG
ncbi:type IV pili methyl-accepting chemotaxis transducer N-terminal domain-containing protein [Roseateles sp.]|uniref:type IV pili methyl-accepting chemotaxis transducer N-terminal domain-containing protein n=1 Tax=Roseateles sp. TaxID=1971397 RepID=UPI002F425952